MEMEEFEKFVERAWGTMRPVRFTATQGETVEELNFSFDDLRSLYIMSTGLPGETGEVLEHLKKLIRDGNIDLNALTKELGDALYYLTRIAGQFKISMSDVMAVNCVKVTDRRARGMIKGSGDDR